MKNFNLYFVYVALLAMVMSSCSKEDNPSSPDDSAGDEMATLGFTAFLEDFDKAMATKQANPGNEGEDAIPACSSEEPAMVRVALRDSGGNWVLDRDGEEDFIEIPVVPGEEGDTNWITDEGTDDELELLAGTYSLEYFDVVDADGNIIYIAPRENDDYGPAEYQNFVSDALPIEGIELRNGVKKYVDVEVLCFDDHYVQEYGYLFFDFTEVDIVYLCLFGNYCDEDGRHTPAEFQFSVWNYTENTIPDTSDDNLLYSDVNETGVYDNGDFYAIPLCVALPARGEEDENVYYGELSMRNGDGEWEVIRLGAFSQNDVESLELDEVPAGYDSGSNYYHFREGECGNPDDSNPCLFSEPMRYANHFDGSYPYAFKTWDGTQYDLPEGPIEFNSLWPEGLYAPTTNPSLVHANWINETHTGNMLVFNGDSSLEQVEYFATTLEDVCPGADYFVSFDLRNVLAVEPGGENDVRLVVRNGNDIILDEDSNPQVISADESEGWITVGLMLKADDNGVLDFTLENDETEANGNDFAIDNMIISNDPAIIVGADKLIIE